MRVRASLGQSGRALALVWQSAPGGRGGAGGADGRLGGAAPVVAYVGKLIIDAVMAAHGRRRRRCARPAIGGRSAGGRRARGRDGGSPARTRARARPPGGRAAPRHRHQRRILEKALRLELRHFEDAEFYDKLTRARREASSRPLSLVQSNFQVVRNVLTLAGYVALLLRFSRLDGPRAAARDGAGCSSPRRGSRGRRSGCATGARPIRAGSSTSNTSSPTTSTPRR